MKPYGQHKPFKGCFCEMCYPRRLKTVRANKKAERQKAKKEAHDEVIALDKKDNPM